MASRASVFREDDYSLLKNLKFELDTEKGSFSLCVWIYLLKSTSSPATIIRQLHSEIEGDAPFLVLNKEKKLTLLPVSFLHEEAPQSGETTSWTEIPCVSADMEFPLEKWVHVGCEVSTCLIRLHVDGVAVGEKSFSSFSNDDSAMNIDKLKKLTLAGADGDEGKLQGYVHYPRILLPSSSVNDHFVDNPPIQLSVDSSCSSEIEEGGDGVWSIVGGKASCRRNFSLDVVLLDAFGHPVKKDMEIVASLQYADNGMPVDKPKSNDAEASLLASYDGIEFASSVRPSKLLQGRASFKLKISQLSSKCDNRLFRIRFDSPRTGRFPFLEAYSNPIRCISRSRNIRTAAAWRKSTSLSLDGSQSLGLDAESPENQLNGGDGNFLIKGIQELKTSQNPVLVMAGEDLNGRNQADPNSDHHCHHPYAGINYSISNNQFKKQGVDALGVTEEVRLKITEGKYNILADSESMQARKSASVVTRSTVPISDAIIFKYCLGGTNERGLLLKELATSATDHTMTNFAQQISTYTGCSHHRYPILIAKRLVQEGIDAWNFISKGNLHILWENAVFEIEQQFMKISRCTTRCLTGQDLELLRKIAGCRDVMTRENFNKMWYWLYPVAFTLSRESINAAWACMSPKWIEGLITKQEAEASLRFQEPGTYILRFPTSRSWPHPDAGSLLVSYSDADRDLHHRLLSLDNREMNQMPLQVLLREEPQLQVLGWVRREITTFP